MGNYPFPIASHSYFHALNKDEERGKFLKSDSYEPHFTYEARFSLDVAQERLAQMVVGSNPYQSLQFVQAAAQLQVDDSKLDLYRQLNKALYGQPNQSYFESVMARVKQRVEPDTEVLWQEICALIGDQTGTGRVIMPDTMIFRTLQEYFDRYRHSQKSAKDLPHQLEEYLRESGLTDKGWQLRLIDDASHARTHHQRKLITIGQYYKPRTQRAIDRIAVHEVYGHAVRGPQPSIAESEGFAILLEQLTGETFKYRRAYRFMASCLGWGLAGKPMTFREVYEVLWRVMVISKSYDELSAKSHAFDECYRAFRGGRPDLAGAVYLKDTVYLQANLAMWEKLATSLPSYDDFVAIIEGKRTIL